MKLDPSLVANGSFTLKIKGKTYVIEGKTQRKVWSGGLRNPATGRKKPVTSGFTRWHGETNGHTGTLNFLDDGSVTGTSVLPGTGNFRVLTKGGLTFLVGYDAGAESAAESAGLRAAQPTAPGAQK